MSELLRVENLVQHFSVSRSQKVRAVNGVSFTIGEGETYGLVGESGSGKTTIGRCVIRIYEPTSGRITFGGEDISGRMSPAVRKKLRSEMQMVFQDPMASLNPRQKVFDIISEGLRIHRLCSSASERTEKVLAMLAMVGLSEEHADRYPHQFSGGQRQRIGIARALVLNPRLIVADEPISALDVSVQAQVVNLMKQLQRSSGCAYLFIAHDLSMVKYVSDRIGVLHLGYLVESGTTAEIFSNPVHPYTKSLLSAIPVADPARERGREPLFYDYASSGIVYGDGIVHRLEGTHEVLATPAEIEAWTRR